MGKFKRIGELNYMAEKKREALDYMKAHPGWVAKQAVRRLVYVWTGYWSFDPRYLAEEPLDPANVFFCSIVSIFTIVGLWHAFRQNWRIAAPYGLVLFFFRCCICSRMLSPIIGVLSILFLWCSRCTDFFPCENERSRREAQRHQLTKS